MPQRRCLRQLQTPDHQSSAATFEVSLRFHRASRLVLGPFPGKAGSLRLLRPRFFRHVGAKLSSPHEQSHFINHFSPRGYRAAETRLQTLKPREGDSGSPLRSAGGFTGRGADVIVIDDPLKADEALSDARRKSVNEWYDNTLRSRLNKQEQGAIIIIMQRLHADDLSLTFRKPRIGGCCLFRRSPKKMNFMRFAVRTGPRDFIGKEGEILQPSLTPRHDLETLRTGMTEYNFAAQYQQNPQPPTGNIVKREWLKFYTPEEKPDDFGTILQSWDTAVKDTELANFSVCTTWGVKDGKPICSTSSEEAGVSRFKKNVKDVAALHNATVVLMEDKSSGSS